MLKSYTIDIEALYKTDSYSDKINGQRFISESDISIIQANRSKILLAIDWQEYLQENACELLSNVKLILKANVSYNDNDEMGCYIDVVFLFKQLHDASRHQLAGLLIDEGVGCIPELSYRQSYEKIKEKCAGMPEILFDSAGNIEHSLKVIRK